MHNILKRQINKFLDDSHLNDPKLELFINAINKTYEDFDADRKLSERSLNISSREVMETNWLLNQYLDIAAVILLTLDMEGRVTMINKTGCLVLGYEKGEIIGKDWFANFLNTIDRPNVHSIFSEIIKGDVSNFKYRETNITTKNGQTKLIAWHNNLLQDKKGNIIGTLSSGQDITEKRNAENELKKKNEELKKFNNLAVGRELKMIELKKRIAEIESKHV